MIKPLFTLVFLATLAAPLLAETFTFALLGDTPYSDYERRELPKMLAAIGEEKPAFAVHDGDIKNGGSLCSDEVFADRLKVFQAAPLPLIYVLGDNEWTDCHRANNGHYEPLERLAKLRALFHADNRSLGQKKITLERQSPPYQEYRENTRWRLGPVLFVGLNLPGSDNNYGLLKEPSAEFLKRGQANRAWIAEAFDLARKEKRQGIVLIIQANPDFQHFEAGLANRGYQDFLEQLRQETLNFPGQVVLVHGDTHSFQINQPLRHPTTREPLANFTRVETFGYPLMGWVKGVIDSEAPGLFRFEAHPWQPEMNKN